MLGVMTRTRDAARRAQIPDVGGPRQPMLIVDDIVKHFKLTGGTPGGRPVVRAVDGVSFVVQKGETLGIVGESGCGKSTTARLLMQLIKPDSGTIVLDGEAVEAPHGITVRQLQRMSRWCSRTLRLAQSAAYAGGHHRLRAACARCAAGGGATSARTMLSAWSAWRPSCSHSAIHTSSPVASVSG